MSLTLNIGKHPDVCLTMLDSSPDIIMGKARFTLPAFLREAADLICDNRSLEYDDPRLELPSWAETVHVISGWEMGKLRLMGRYEIHLNPTMHTSAAEAPLHFLTELISVGDLVVAVEHIIITCDLATKDPRTEFVNWLASLQVEDGRRAGRHLLIPPRDLRFSDPSDP